MLIVQTQKKSIKVAEAVSGATVLYHEATFVSKDQKRATTTFHSSTKDAAEIGQKAKVKNLLDIFHLVTKPIISIKKKWRDSLPIVLSQKMVCVLI